VIEFSGVSKTFRHGSGAKLLRGYIQDLFRKRGKGLFYALRNVSFRVEDGESLAIVGRNGAGKSTLLSLVAGLFPPSEGHVSVAGRTTALLELGSGFHQELTGIENLHLNAALLGLSRKRTAEVFDEILAFADIGEFVRDPIRTYSMGMLMRLAFSVAIHADPDILIVDEVLAVGDYAFQQKCFDRIRRFRAAGKTLVFVSHQAALVRELCERALWLDRGELVMDGPASKVLDAYAGPAAPKALG
jgi:ABC-type polysaccharide/polyol phosphate transport system ATPase subunit